MATTLQVENRIERIEGFRIAFRHPHGRNVRDDRQNLPQYPYERALKGNATVRQWIDLRFHPNYSGWDVEVLEPNGKPVHNRTLLATVRKGYDA